MNEARKSDDPTFVVGEDAGGQGRNPPQPPRERRRLGLRYGAGADAKGERP